MTEQLHQETSEKEIKLPLEIRGKWVRFREKLPFAGRKFVKNTAPCSVIIGVKGSGKSSLAENIATHFSDPLKHPSKTGKILDFFGSRDNEGAAWCRSPYADSILFICGDNTDISSSSWDFKHIRDVRLGDFARYHVFIAVSAFFSNLRSEHHFIQTAMDLLRHRTSWTRPDALVIREAANLIFSRISLKENQAEAKAHTIYTLREARHSGFAVCTDAIRFKSVDVDLRSIADYSFIKACGVYGLPGELKWLYKYFEPFGVMRCPVDRFIILSKKGTIGRGCFQYPKWHKEPKENLLKEFDIQVEHGDAINYGDKGFKRVSDFEHVEIMRTRHEEGENGKPLGMDKIADRLKRSRRTIYLQITNHNQSIQQDGECNRCSRVQSPYAKIEV